MMSWRVKRQLIKRQLLEQEHGNSERSHDRKWTLMEEPIIKTLHNNSTWSLKLMKLPSRVPYLCEYCEKYSVM